MANTILGIDIGTSSVKACVVEFDEDGNKFVIREQAKCQYDSDTIKVYSVPLAYSQQNVEVILQSVGMVLQKIDLKQIDLVSVCGQMHGCVLWHSDSLRSCTWKDGQPLLTNVIISDLYDWTDGRCEKDFLNSLPVPDSFADQISSGFGCASLFWLSKHESNYLLQFDSSGTIMDLFVCLLCGLDKASISVHNAHSWGYFNPQKRTWNTELGSKFPVHLLPTVVEVNSIVGHSRDNRFGLPKNTPTLVALGDLQSTLQLALEHNSHAIVMNIGTSAQLCRLMDDKFEPQRKSTTNYQSVDYFPYNDNQYLAVAASLNGGNVLRGFATFVQEMVSTMTGVKLSEQQVWDKLTSLHRSDSGNSAGTNLKITPTLFGERYQPGTFMSIENIRAEMPKLLELTRCLCASLVENLFDMMPIDLFNYSSANKATISIICTGSVMSKNYILQTMFEKVLQQRLSKLDHLSTQVNYIEQCDADVGCTLFARRLIVRPKDQN